jgi:hypothetical protein
MSHGIVLTLLLAVATAGLFAAIALASWWLEPGQRVERVLRQGLAGPPDMLSVAEARRQGAALRIEDGALAIVRGVGDSGLVYDLHELIGAELIFDGAVCARSFRGEGRRALDQVNPSVTSIVLRFVFDDVHDPEFEFELYKPSDMGRRGDAGPEAMVLVARRWFAKLEAVLRRP